MNQSYSFAPKTLRRHVYDLLHNEDYDSAWARRIDGFLIAIILANVATVILSSDIIWYHAHHQLFDSFEHFSIGVFTIEYLLRLWSAAEHKPQYSVAYNRYTWIKHPHGIIDFLAIAPAYLNFFLPIDLRYLIVLRLLRLFKLTRYFVALRLLLKVVAKEKESFKAVLLILLILMVIAASGIHLVEHQAQPDKFDTIPKSMWWAVVTLTTVGYGDVVPITPLGKLLGAAMTILGVGLAALPAGILASGLANELSLRREHLEMMFRERLLADDVDLSANREKIDKLRREIGLSKEQALMVIDQLLKEQAIEQQRQQNLNFCPHCGHSLHTHHD